jgi:hypothetical protein
MKDREEVNYLKYLTSKSLPKRLFSAFCGVKKRRTLITSEFLDHSATIENEIKRVGLGWDRKGSIKRLGTFQRNA